MQVMSRRLPLLLAIAVLIVHAIGNPHYGFFRDELYFIICGRHPQFGYVDQPPLVPLLAALSQSFGHSLFLLRFLSSLCAAAGAYVTCLLVIEFGGGAFAQIIAVLTFLFTPVLLSFGDLFSTESIGLFTWPLVALLVVRIARGANPTSWAWVGLVVGLTLESKYSIAFFVLALLIGLLSTPQRRALMTPWSLIGLVIAVLIALPNFLWQAHFGFPMLELLRNGQLGKNVVVGPLAYLGQELIITGLFLALIWIIGLLWLLRNASARFLGLAYAVLIVEMILFHGKHYYPAAVYSILIAAGSVQIEAWTVAKQLARAAVTAVIVLWGLAMLPQDLPILSEESFVKYDATFRSILHLPRSTTATEGNRETSELPGDWADMHGWPEMAAAAARVYDSLPAADKAQAVVFAGNYGEASAIKFFEPGVPVISEHNQYWLWGTQGYSGNVLVQVNGSCFYADKLFASRTRVATLNTPWAIAYERDIPIWICRDIKKPLSNYWADLKTYE